MAGKKANMNDLTIKLVSSFDLLYSEPKEWEIIEMTCNQISSHAVDDERHFTDLTVNKTYKTYGETVTTAYDGLVLLSYQDAVVGWCSFIRLKNVLLIENLSFERDIFSNMIAVFITMFMNEFQRRVHCDPHMKVALFVHHNDEEFIQQLTNIKHQGDCFEVVDKPVGRVYNTKQIEAGDLGVTWKQLGRDHKSKYSLYSSKSLAELKSFHVPKSLAILGEMETFDAEDEMTTEKSPPNDKPRKRGRPKTKPDPFAHRPKKRSIWKSARPKEQRIQLSSPQSTLNSPPKSPLRFRSASRSTTPLRK